MKLPGAFFSRFLIFFAHFHHIRFSKRNKRYKIAFNERNKNEDEKKTTKNHNENRRRRRRNLQINCLKPTNENKTKQSEEKLDRKFICKEICFYFSVCCVFTIRHFASIITTWMSNVDSMISIIDYIASKSSDHAWINLSWILAIVLVCGM